MKIKEIALCALFVAIIAVCAQLAVPFPGGVPITLQTFAIAFAGYFLGTKKGTLCVLVYLLLGAVGLPVFSGLKGGFAALVGYTGGFLFGFLGLSLLAGLSLRYPKRLAQWGMGILGLLFCHLLGTLWYMYLAKVPFGTACALVCLPFLVKDILSVILAATMAALLKKRIGNSR